EYGRSACSRHLPPCGGGRSARCARGSGGGYGAARLRGPPSPSLPHKGGGGRLRRVLRAVRSRRGDVIPVTTLAGKNVAVFGLGTSGLATCAALRAGGARAIAFDDDATKVAAAATRGVATADLRKLDWGGCAALVLSPGVPLTHPTPHWSVALARNAGVEVIGDVELYCRERRAVVPGAPFVAVTGTNGKSTTTALIAHVLETAGMAAQRGGNIGVAVLSLDPPAPDRAHVVECSSYQIELPPSLDPSVPI